MSHASTKHLPPALHVLVCDYGWIHICLGLVGNCAFVVGSFLFFSASTKQVALWLFVIGSSGMLLGSIGNALVKYEKD
jgi:hypothetical protein